MDNYLKSNYEYLILIYKDNIEYFTKCKYECMRNGQFIAIPFYNAKINELYKKVSYLYGLLENLNNEQTKER